MEQFQADMATRNNPKDNRRPIFNATYQHIAGHNEEWTALNIKIDDAYASQYIGSEKNQGLLYDRRVELQNEGITLYLKKEAASNLFYNNAKTNNLETVIDYTGAYEIDDYPQDTRNLKLKKLDNGGYSITGDMLMGLNEEGNKIWDPMGVHYWNPQTDPDKVMIDFRNYMDGIVKGVRNDQAAYNLSPKGIKNPQQLLN